MSYKTVGCLTILALLLCAAHVCSQQPPQHSLFMKDQKKAVSVSIDSETPRGILIVRLGKKMFVQIDQFDRIEYSFKQFEVKIPLANGQKQEAQYYDAKSSAKKNEHLNEAIKKYEEAHLKAKGSGNKFGVRNIEYKIAVLYAEKAQLEGGDAAQQLALSYLSQFRKNHPISWQITHLLQVLARLQMQLGRFGDAEGTYEELAKADIGKEAKWEAELMVAQVRLRANKPDQANQALEALLNKVPKGHKIVGRARVYQAEVLVLKGMSGQAETLLRGIIKSTNNATMKAVAYNTLGMSYYKKAEYKKALWEFLWVDVVYNQDNYQHARALYYLWGTFTQLGDTKRAEECRNELINDPQFGGLEFQARAKERKPPAAAP